MPRAGGAIDEAANEAVSLMSGSLAYSSWVELHLECRKLKDVDVFRYGLLTAFGSVDQGWCGRA